jgi:carbon-monoxide dehydrogenase large subunit
LSGPLVGRSVPRGEDFALITGRARFVDNLTAPQMVHAILVRSSYARARIVSVGLQPALETPGVVAAFAGEDLLGDWASPLPAMWTVSDETNIPSHWPLAIEEVKHPGDPVAVVLAESTAAAKDGAEAVAVEYEPLDAVVDVRVALEPDSPLVHPDFGTNRCFTLRYAHGRPTDEVFQQADVRISRVLNQQRLIPSPM